MTDRSNDVLLICIPCNSLWLIVPLVYSLYVSPVTRYDWSFQWCTSYMYPLYLVMTDRSNDVLLICIPLLLVMTDRSNGVLLICTPCNSLWLIVPMMYFLYVSPVSRYDWSFHWCTPYMYPLYLVMTDRSNGVLLICTPCNSLWLIVPMIYSLYVSHVTRYDWSFHWCTPYMYPL